MEKTYRQRLLHVVARSFGLYMGARLSGWDADVQLQLYGKLSKALNEYDKKNQHEKDKDIYRATKGNGRGIYHFCR